MSGEQLLRTTLQNALDRISKLLQGDLLIGNADIDHADGPLQSEGERQQWRHFAGRASLPGAEDCRVQTVRCRNIRVAGALDECLAQSQEISAGGHEFAEITDQSRDDRVLRASAVQEGCGLNLELGGIVAQRLGTAGIRSPVALKIDKELHSA